MTGAEYGIQPALIPHGKPILVTGLHGQLAQALAAQGGPRIRLAGRPELDFDHPATLATTVARVAPAAIINAAAWTHVDLAESEPAAATRANRDAPHTLARLCAERGIPLLHISTDYVFDGLKGTPYTERDPTSPRCVYGRTKAEGEEAVLRTHAQSIVLRTAWVYSAHGKNFVRSILNAGQQQPQLRVVDDQRGNPTSADDLAWTILRILCQIEHTGWQERYAGLVHACGTGDASWYELAVQTFKAAARHGLTAPDIVPIATKDWPTATPRPTDTRLNTGRLHQTFGLTLPHWQDSLHNTVHQILSTSPQKEAQN